MMVRYKSDPVVKTIFASNKLASGIHEQVGLLQRQLGCTLFIRAFNLSRVNCGSAIPLSLRSSTLR
jgi:hypothetical protein